MIVSIADWGVVGDGSDETAAIQAAFDSARLGCWLYFPRSPAWYLVTDQINFHRPLNLIFESSALLLGGFDDPDKYVLNMRMLVNVSGGTSGDVRGLQLINPRIEVAFGTEGAGALNIEGQDPAEVPGSQDLPLLSVQVRGGFLAVPSASSGVALRIAGNWSQLHTIEGVDIFNGIHVDNAADACRFQRNLFFGERTGIRLEPHVGAFRWLITDNVMVSQDGALYVTGAGEVEFSRNQVETAEEYGANASTYGASVTLDATAYDIHTINFEGNNFAGGPNVQSHIHMRTDSGKYVEGVRIGINSWGTVDAGSAKDIILADSRVRYTAIAANQQPRNDGAQRGGSAFTTYPTMGANTLDVDTLLVVDDSGTGTANVRKNAVALGGASATALLNSWTCDAAMRFWKAADGEARFTSTADGPTAAQASVVIGTLPVGFRPANDELFTLPAYDLGSGALKSVVALVQASSGNIVVTYSGGNTGNIRCGMAAINFVAKREGYNPGY